MSRAQPLKALHHFQKLVTDKEDTKHVFHIIEALKGKTLLRDLKAFAKTQKGAARISERRYLPPLLDNHETIRKLPENSVGRAYLNFMKREGLSAAGLVHEYDKFIKGTPVYDDLIDWYAKRIRDTHDLLHVLTGYNRDALGEACVLAHSYSHNRSPGVIFISYMSGRSVKRITPRGTPVLKAVREAQVLGNKATAIAEEDILALLAEPLGSARLRMGIGIPTAYNRVHEMCRNAGQDPLKLLAAP